MKPRARVILAEDHALVAERLAALIADEFELVATVSDGVQLVEVSKRFRPDVIVTDLSMPGLDGFQAVQRLRESGVAAGVILLTMHTERETAAEALRLGARGFVLKHFAGEELIDAIDQVLEGRVFVSAAIRTGR